MLLQPLDNGSIALAQDSTLSLYELKAIAKYLPELHERRLLDAEQINKESFYKSLIQKYQDDKEQYQKKEKLLEANIEAIKPAWYDHFWIGSAITGIVAFTTYLIVNGAK